MGAKHIPPDKARENSIFSLVGVADDLPWIFTCAAL